MEHYSAVKKEEKFTFYNSMDGPGEQNVSEISQLVKDKYCMTSFIMWNLMNRIN